MRNPSFSKDMIKSPETFFYPTISINGVDVTDRVSSVQLQADMDTLGWAAALEITNHPSLPDFTPFSGGPYSDLLKPGKLVKIWVRATNQKGDYGGTKDLVFEGITGDEIMVHKDVRKSDTITLRVRSKNKKRLQDLFILDQYVYPVGARGGEPWEIGDENAFESAVDVAQDILDEHVPSPPTLRVIDDPLFSVYPYVVGESDVWTVLQNLFNTTGFVLTDAYYGATDSFELVLFDPLARTPGDTIAAQHYRLADQSFADTEIRNVVRIHYRSRTPDSDMAAGAKALPYAPEGILYVESQDDNSIALYGRRAMSIVEDETSLIDTYAEAKELADMILNDLKKLGSQISLELPTCLYYVEPYDVLTISGPVSGEATVMSIEWQISRAGGRSDVSTKLVVSIFKE